MTENTQQVRSPAPQAPQGDRGRRRLTASTVFAGVTALALAGALVFAGRNGCKKPAPEKIVKEKVVQVQKEYCPQPTKGDDNCETEKGEHDPLSKTFDPKSCGYCGDDVIQPWENEENCPYDTRCNAGKRIWRKHFAKYELDGDKVKLKVVRINDLCQNKPIRSTTQIPKKDGMAAVMKADVKPEVKSDGSGCKDNDSGPLGAIKSSIKAKIRSRIKYMWTLGVPDSKDAMATATLKIDNGVLKDIPVTVTWSGGSKTFTAEQLGLGGLKGRHIGYGTKRGCRLYVKKSIPAGAR